MELPLDYIITGCVNWADDTGKCVDTTIDLAFSAWDIADIILQYLCCHNCGAKAGKFLNFH